VDTVSSLARSTLGHTHAIRQKLTKEMLDKAAFREALDVINKLDLSPDQAFALNILCSVKQHVSEYGAEYFQSRTYQDLIDEVVGSNTSR
jgi:hypothetical protein